MRTMKGIGFFLVAAGVAISGLLCGNAWARPLGPGDVFPDFTHFNNLDTQECDYLKIDSADDFHLGSLGHDLIVLEFINVFCDLCRDEVELYNGLYDISRTDPELGGGFAVLGVAVGNSFEEVMQFSEELLVRYPILIDPERDIFEVTGSVRGAPQTYVLQRQDDRFIVRHYSRGATGRDEFADILRRLTGSAVEAAPVPAFSYCVMIDEVKHTEKQFAGSRVLLYFPHDRSYPHDSDTRNTARQVEVLRRILLQYPDMRIVVIEPEKTSVQSFKNIELPPEILRASGDKALFDQLASDKYPTVYYIDSDGKAVFRGQALTLPILRSMLEGRYRAEPDMPEPEIISLITRTLAEQDADVRDTRTSTLEGHTVYRTTTEDPQRFYFSRLESSPSLCDLCHDSHFIYSIDRRGTIVALIPIALPKWGNVYWNEAEVRAFQKAFIGKNILEIFQFTAAHDAVSGATITSSIVYDGFNRGKSIFRTQIQSDPGPAPKNQSARSSASN